MTPETNVWWVNQGTTQREAQDRGDLWAPYLDSGGHTQYHWETMDEVLEGDIVLHYANGALRYVSKVLAKAVPEQRPGTTWQQEGRRVRVDYHQLLPVIPLRAFAQEILPLNIRQGPLTGVGSVKQGYLFRFSEDGVRIIQAAQPETAWPDFAALAPNPPQVRSWSYRSGEPRLIGIKRVDWSVFEEGTHVPQQYVALFDGANGGAKIAPGESHEISLSVLDKSYVARLINTNRKDSNGDAYSLNWSSNRALCDQLKQSFTRSLDFITGQRDARTPDGRSRIIVPIEQAEYMAFYKTDEPYSYRVELTQQKEEPVQASYQDAMAALTRTIEQTGFVYEPWQLAAYVTALRTKPFIILAGVTGTGKSKLPKLVCDGTGGTSLLVPVRPDWTDSSEVLGYVDLAGKFRPGRLLAYAQTASANLGIHHVAIIDEMNLARVEHYFAEVLSCIEDRSASETGGFSSCPLLNATLNDDDQPWQDQCLPPNLAIVGTVNMDESAHGFSRKVLDRAFTLELSDIDLHRWTSAVDTLVDRQRWPVDWWFPRAIHLAGLKDLTDGEVATVNRVVDILTEINKTLMQAQLQVGYRTRDELALFTLHAADMTDLFSTRDGKPVDPIDLGILMKVLPRIAGGSMAIRHVLLELVAWATGSQQQANDDIGVVLKPWIDAGRPSTQDGALYPRTAARLYLMLDRFHAEGYTSFWL